jgi:hypothetical protein
MQKQAGQMQKRAAGKEGDVAVGSVVQIAIDDVDRAKVDDHNLTCIVVELVEKGSTQKEIKYRLATQGGRSTRAATSSFCRRPPRVSWGCSLCWMGGVSSHRPSEFGPSRRLPRRLAARGLFTALARAPATRTRARASRRGASAILAATRAAKSARTTIESNQSHASMLHSVADTLLQ